MPKCGECREFPEERGTNCPYRWGSGCEPQADDDIRSCPCFHPAGEPTEGEMLDWLEDHRPDINPWDKNQDFSEDAWSILWCEKGELADRRSFGKTLRSAIREAMKIGEQ